MERERKRERATKRVRERGFMFSRVRTPSSPVRERERKKGERGKEREGERK